MSLTRAQVREIDRRAVEEFGIPSIVLMENAGRGAAELMAKLNPERQRVAIACGRGNNGGDGFVMARHLDRLGVPSCVWLFADPDELSQDAAVNHRVIERMGLPLTVCRTSPLAGVFSGFGWIVDALFGTGLDRAIMSPLAEVVQAINTAVSQVLAIDVPSGLDTDTGSPLGPTVRANHTVTFVGLKEGFLFPESRRWVGTIHFADIGAPQRLIDEYLG